MNVRANVALREANALGSSRRSGGEDQNLHLVFARARNIGGVVDVLNGEICDISSTEIKKHLNNKEYLMRYLPEKVYNYILTNNLYSGE